VERLQRYQWPGNARELQNVMERAAILARNGKLVLNLPSEGADADLAESVAVTPPAVVGARILTAKDIEALEARNLIAAVDFCKGRISGAGGAAELLDMNPQTVYSRLRKLRSYGALG
jgi:transcriptional regulator of acetoin/glycerol metabolism